MVPTCSASLGATGTTGWTALPPMTSAPLIGTEEISHISNNIAGQLFRQRASRTARNGPSGAASRGSAGHLLGHHEAGALEVLAQDRLGGGGVAREDVPDHLAVLLLRLAQAGERAHVH